MTRPPHECQRCGRSIPLESASGSSFLLCACGATARVDLFVRYFEPFPTGSAAAERTADQASCFFHESKTAQAPCDLCGRYLCSTCQVSVDKLQLCPSCLEGPAVKAGYSRLENQRPLHDTVTLSLSLIPCLFPITVYRLFRYYGSDCGVTPRSRYRNWIASVLVLMQLLGALALLALAVSDA